MAPTVPSPEHSTHSIVAARYARALTAADRPAVRRGRPLRPSRRHHYDQTFEAGILDTIRPEDTA
ncbi:hypothetical protein GCM10010215_48880 [Streptomyces virginiae]|uniref:Uncharacterized protein n=1 Tax=Streptomyces virginiae TaxID=1961 RepID=A0ABQ3NGG3_STRVG|nr:hypothetical protein GCM10010215_48880 [Streptomyces virginiae]GHI11864.1 hypothetical protein Scinn_13270 [Streptomyces virginiae]GLV94786.1 hypothetical protein Slala04_62400 [Streptomyces lavendulae subsp. lavendulae]